MPLNSTKSYIYYMCIKRIWHWITSKDWYAIEPNPTKFLEPSDYFTVINCIFTFCIINVFACFGGVIVQLELAKQKFPNKTTIHCAAFKSHSEGNNAQHISALTWTIPPTTPGNLHGFIWFGHVIYVSKNSTHQNMAKVLTHSRVLSLNTFLPKT